MTAIEQIVAALRSAGVEVSDVLIPEQCALVYAFDGPPVHITAQFAPEVSEAVDASPAYFSPNELPPSHPPSYACDCAECRAARASASNPHGYVMRREEP